jgi:hypothetical protein
MGLIEAIVIAGITFGTVIAGTCDAKNVEAEKCFTKEGITIEYEYPNSHGKN